MLTSFSTMPQPRDVRNPIVRTYLSATTSPSGETKIHARLYSRDYDLDKRGTGRTVDEALRRARAGVEASTPRRYR